MTDNDLNASATGASKMKGCDTMAKATKNEGVTQEQLDACKRPADLARLLNVDGKRLRDALRKSGVYVSKGDTFTNDAKVAMVERFTPKA